MSIATAVRIIKFDAGHRVVNHESKCRNFHGHEYKAEVFASAPYLDLLGRVVDFSVIKDRVGGFIDSHWDHAMLINAADPDLETFKTLDGGQKIYVCPYNPTAENIAADLFHRCKSLLDGTGVTVTKIKLWETSNCYVEYVET